MRRDDILRTVIICGSWEGEAPAEPHVSTEFRLGRSLALPKQRDLVFNRASEWLPPHYITSPIPSSSTDTPMPLSVPPEQEPQEQEEVRLYRQLHGLPELLEEIEASEKDELQLQACLREKYSPEIVRAALQVVSLRNRAENKFSRASQMWFDRVGLEQATAEAVAHHKAKRFSGEVWDLCAGIGGDTMALAEHCQIHAVDFSPLRNLVNQYNCGAYGVDESVEFRSQDVSKLHPKDTWIHIDPDRRGKNQNRSLRLQDSLPQPDVLKKLIAENRGGAIKCSPASNFAGFFSDVECELISLNGECKEATLWFGELTGPYEWRATVLPENESMAGDPMSARVSVGGIAQFFFDPNPALVRSGLLEVLAAKENLSRIDPEDEYLTGDRLSSSPFVQPFEVRAVLANNEKTIRKYVKEHDVGIVEIKHRRLRVEVERLQRNLRGSGEESTTIVFTRIGGKAKAVVCRRCSSKC